MEEEKIKGFMKVINKINIKTMSVADKIVDLLNATVKKFGDNGYLFYGFLASSLMFVATTSLRFVPKVDWSICFIIRGLSNYLFGMIATSIYQKDTSFAGKNLLYVNQRNILMGCHQLFFQYALVVLPLSVVWVIVNSCPLFVFIVNYFMFSASLTAKQLQFLFISLLGVCFITNPEIYQVALDLLFKITNRNQQQQEVQPTGTTISENQESSTLSYISMLFLVAQILWAYSVSVIKKANNINSLSINLHLGIVLITMGSVAYFQRSDQIPTPKIHDLLLVFLIFGIGTFIPSLIFVQGTIIAKCQGKYSLTTYVTVFYSYIFQMFYEHKIPSLPELFGISLAFYGLFKLMVK